MLAEVIQQQQTVFELAGLPAGWLRVLGLLGLVGLLSLVVWFYRREARAGASRWLRFALAAIRCAVLLGLALIWLDPVIATYTRQTVTASVGVLVDASASMAIADVAEAEGAGQGARMQRVGELLTRNESDWLRRLAARNELLLFTFGDRATRVAPPPGAASTAVAASAPASAPAPLATALTPDQAATDLGQGLAALIEQAGESPLAGVVVLSDGAINRGPPAIDVAALARRYGAPIFAVGVGQPSEPPSLRVANLTAPAAAPLGDPLELKAEVVASGIEPRTVTIELSVQRVDGGEPGPERTLATREITVGGQQPAPDLRFKANADTAGQFIYRARLSDPGPGVLTGPPRETVVTVLDERLKVLIVAGRPSFDYRFVTRLLERDKSIDVSCWLQSADENALRDGDVQIHELPRKTEDILAYDVVLLMDPDPRELDSSWAVAVRRLVDELGGGLLLQAGPHFTTRFLSDPRLEDVTAMIPVVADADADVRLSALGSFRTVASPLIVPDEALAHPLLRLGGDDAGTRLVWKALPGVWWSLPVLREKPLASVLLRQDNRALANQFGANVLLAAQPFGAGRTAFLGFDGTWRWRATAERYFDRFWVQMVRYLAQARRQGASRRGAIVLDRETVTVGELVKIEARVLDESFAPWQEPQIDAQAGFADGGSESLHLSAIPGREGWFAGRLSPGRPGSVVVRVPLPGATGADAALSRHLLVQPPDRELRTLRQRVDDLQLLAERTHGQYFTLERADQVPDLIENATVQKPPVPGPREALWDRTWVLLALATLLAVEWTLRRRNHLL